jgi:hypothetical protein
VIARGGLHAPYVLNRGQQGRPVAATHYLNHSTLD